MDTQQRDYDPRESTNMAKTRTKRSKYDDHFRREAVRLLDTRGSRTVEDVAESLGVSSSMLHRWKKKFGNGARAPADQDTEADSAAELRALRKRLREVEMERDILKKATAFFAKESR